MLELNVSLGHKEEGWTRWRNNDKYHVFRDEDTRI